MSKTFLLISITWFSSLAFAAVRDNPPTCALFASPTQVMLGQSIKLSLSTFGKVTSANIDGNSVPNSGGDLMITPSSKGTFTAKGHVSGPGGSFDCQAQYTVFSETTMGDLLIVDLKSGWWEGAGGNFYRTILSKMTELDPRARIEYHSIIWTGGGPMPGPGPQPGPQPDPEPGPGPGGEGFEGISAVYQGTSKEEKRFDENTFPNKAWTAYKHVWILSGVGDFPLRDLPLSHELYTRIRNGLRPTKANMLVGTGGFHYMHANDIMGLLGGSFSFNSQMKTPREIFLQFGEQFEIDSYLTKGQNCSSHEILAGVNRLPERLSQGGGPDPDPEPGPGPMPGDFSVDSDYLNISGSGLQSVCRNESGQTVIAAGQAAGRKVVLDGGLQRFYGLLNEPNGDVSRYLSNVMEYLKK